MTTPERILIQQELAENPYTSHKAIATKLGIGTSAVILLCNEMNKGRCKHGKKPTRKPGHEIEIKGRTRRAVSVAITDEEWKAFKDKYDRPGDRLGEMIRQDL